MAGPKDGRPSRDRRPGRAGIGPGPAYKPSSSGGGTSHKGGKTRGNGGGSGGKGGSKSSFASPEMVRAVYMVALIPVCVILGLAGYFTHAVFFGGN